jgi:hypothetical protein
MILDNLDATVNAQSRPAPAATVQAPTVTVTGCYWCEWGRIGFAALVLWALWGRA